MVRPIQFLRPSPSGSSLLCADEVLQTNYVIANNQCQIGSTIIVINSKIILKPIQQDAFKHLTTLLKTKGVRKILAFLRTEQR